MVKEIIKEKHGELGNFEELAQIGGFEIDLEDRSWSGSRNFCKMFGLDFSKILSFQDLKAILHPDFYETAILKFEECIKRGYCRSFECLCIDANNNPLYMECRVKLYYDDKGNPLKILGTLQNITDRKASEQRLSDLNKIKDEVLSIVAHDLKSPINQIGGVLNLLRMEENDTSNDYLNYIENACGIASNIINDLIEMAELNQPDYLIEKSSIDINDLVKVAETHYSAQAKVKNISIDCVMCENAVAKVHPIKFARVLDNLISNAIKFSYPNSYVKIKTEAYGKKLVIRIKDMGIGISEEKLPYIFDRFSIARQNGTNGEKSTGLGLSIVKNIIALHHGKISVNSQPGKGSEFIVELPR